MINEGFKSKPLDRYPFMENDLKNYGVNTIKVLCDNDLEHLSDYVTYINKNVVEDIIEFRLFDCGNFYFCLFKVAFKVNPDVGIATNIMRLNKKYVSSQPSRGLINSFYTIGEIKWSSLAFDIKKVFETDDFLFLTERDDGLIFTSTWLK